MTDMIDAKAGDVPRYLQEFPDFGPMDVEIPEGFEDVSWKNEDCPCFASRDLGLFLYVDNAEALPGGARRQHGIRRFVVITGSVEAGEVYHTEHHDILAATDDYEEALASIELRRQAVKAAHPAP
jgi:hypothetical protein